VALKADRWGRFVNDENASAYFQFRLARAGWDVDFALEPKVENRLVRRLTAVSNEVMAEAESEEKGRRSRLGMDGQARLGHWLSRAPFGYNRVAVNKLNGRERVLEPGERGSPLERNTLKPGTARDVRTVRSIFARYAKGESMDAIADALNDSKARGPWDDYKNRGGVTRWMPGTVRVLLGNVAYIGTVHFGRRSRRSPDEQIVVENAHPPLIDRETWSIVQHRLSRIVPKPRGDSTFLLTGLIHCARCNSLVTGGGGARPDADDPGEHRYYRDRGGVRYPPICRPTLMVKQRLLEAEVARCVETTALEARKKGRLAVAEREIERQRVALSSKATPKELETERTELEKQRKRLVDRVAKGVLSDEDAAEKLVEIRTALAGLKAASERERFDAAAQVASQEHVLSLTRQFLSDDTFRSERIAMLATADRSLYREWLRGWVVGISLQKNAAGDVEGEVIVRRAPTMCPSDSVVSHDRAR